MKTGTVPILILATFSIVGFVALPVSAAKSPAMEACSKQWDDMKAAGKTGGKTWPSFWSDCSKDFAAKNTTEAAAPEKPAKAEKATTKKAVTSVRNEDDNASSAQQKKDCDARWDCEQGKNWRPWMARLFPIYVQVHLIPTSMHRRATARSA